MQPNICVCVISFNRPHYLKLVLDGLKKNTIKYPTYLIQDGTVNKFSGKEWAAVEDIQRCVDVFHQVFPMEIALTSTYNVGIALQYNRAEEWAFKFNSYEAVIFIEDDFFPGPQYLEILTDLYQKTKYIKQIGTLTAYGPDRFVTVEEQTEKQFKLEKAIPSWGYLLPRSRWLERRAAHQSYLDLVDKVDYRDRPQEQIVSWIRDNGFDIDCSSQDAAHSIAMNRAGQIKLSTCTRNAHYLGRDGIHMNPLEFDNGYYGKDQIWEYKSLDFKIPDVQELDKMILDIRQARWI